MKGCISMRMSYEETMNAIASVLTGEIDRLNSLPDDEARIEARSGLISVGIIDNNGDLTAPYAALSRNVLL